MQVEMRKSQFFEHSQEVVPMVCKVFCFEASVHDERNLCISVSPVDVNQASVTDTNALLQVGKEYLVGL